MAFYISGPKLLFETTEISTHPNSTQQESNYIYLYTTKFETTIKIRVNRIRDNESQLYLNINFLIICRYFNLVKNQRTILLHTENSQVVTTLKF